MHKSSFSVKKLLQGLGSLSFLFAKFRRNCNGKFSAKSICTYRNSENFETLAANVASKQMLKIHNGRFVIYTALHIYLPCITTESLFRSSLINCELRFLIFLLTDTRMNMPDTRLVPGLKNMPVPVLLTRKTRPAGGASSPANKNGRCTGAFLLV